MLSKGQRVFGDLAQPARLTMGRLRPSEYAKERIKVRLVKHRTSACVSVDSQPSRTDRPVLRSSRCDGQASSIRTYRRLSEAVRALCLVDGCFCRVDMSLP